MAAKRICASKIGGGVPEKAASRLQTQVIGGDALQPAAAFYSPTDFSFSSSDPQIHPDIIIDLRRILLLLFSFITLSFFTKNICSSMESVSKYLTVLSVFFRSPIARASIERDALAFDSLGTQLEVFQGLLGSVYSNAT